MPKYEKRARAVMEAIYDDAVAYSLRDRDEDNPAMPDEAPLVRMRLACRAAENLLLSDDVLTAAGLTWTEAKLRIDQWLIDRSEHEHAPVMEQFRAGGYDRFNFNLKDIRMIILSEILQKTAPWEVLVGKQIAKLAETGTATTTEGSLAAFLGDKVYVNLLGPNSGSGSIV